MSNVVISKTFGAPSKRFAEQRSANDELGAGIHSSYSVIGYRGKVWSIKSSGNEIPLMREDGDGARSSIEVVIVKSASALSKIFYANGYQDGANAAPDCWSADGVKPDASVQNKECATCAACPRNAWGSRVTEAGKQGKQCSDSRRVAVVPVNDMTNEAYGGPMLLRVPAASLKDLKAYGEQLNSYGYPYYEVATRISFDVKESYPKFVFAAMRPLDDDEVAAVTQLRSDKRVGQLLNEAVEQKTAPAQEAAAEVPSSPFEMAPAAAAAKSSASPKAPASTATKTATATAAAAPKTSPKVTSKPSPTKPPVQVAEEIEETEDEDVTSSGNGVASFDDLLDDIL